MNTAILRMVKFADSKLDMKWGMNSDYDECAPAAWAALVTSIACVPLAFLSKAAYPMWEFQLVPLIESQQRIGEKDSSDESTHHNDTHVVVERTTSKDNASLTSPLIESEG